MNRDEISYLRKNELNTHPKEYQTLNSQIEYVWVFNQKKASKVTAFISININYKTETNV